MIKFSTANKSDKHYYAGNKIKKYFAKIEVMLNRSQQHDRIDKYASLRIVSMLCHVSPLIIRMQAVIVQERITYFKSPNTFFINQKYSSRVKHRTIEKIVMIK